jgi:hypothetical protein
LRILSRNSSRNSLKRGSGNLILMTEDNDQQIEKIKQLSSNFEKLENEKLSLE